MQGADLSPEQLSGIATFVVAARARNFSEAAEKLAVSRSAVAKSVARLEGRLGVKLFHRTTRKIALTSEGEAYFAACSRALQEISATESDLVQGESSPSGPLRIDMPVVFGRKSMLPVLAAVVRDHPALSLTLTFNEELVDPIEEGIDLLIRFGDLQDSSSLMSRRLSRHRLVICASPDYLALRGTPEHLHELSSHACLVLSRRGHLLHWIVGDGQESRRFLPAVTHSIGDGDALVEAAVLGLGICQFPGGLVNDHLCEGRLVSILEPWATATVDMHAVWPKGSQRRPKVRHVIDVLAALADKGAL